jgi:hypothetical protein
LNMQGGFRNPVATIIAPGVVDTVNLANGAITSIKLASSLQSDNYDGTDVATGDATQGWRIERNTGSAEFQDLRLRGSIIGNLTLDTNGVLRTAASGQRIELGGATADQITFYTGHANEILPGKILVAASGGVGAVTFTGPLMSAGGNTPVIAFASNLGGGITSQIGLIASNLELTGPIEYSELGSDVDDGAPCTFTNAGYLDLDALTGGAGSLTAVADTVEIGASGRALVIISAQFSGNTLGVFSLLSVRFSGATTQAATDSWCAFFQVWAAGRQGQTSRARVFTGLNIGTTTVECQARAIVGGPTEVAEIQRVSLVVIPL